MAEHIKNPDNDNLIKYLEEYFDTEESKENLPKQPERKEAKIKRALNAGDRLISILENLNKNFDDLLYVDDIQYKGKCKGICYYVSLNKEVSDPRILNFNVLGSAGNIDFCVPKYIMNRTDFIKQNNSGWKNISINKYSNNYIISAISEYLHKILGDDELDKVLKEKSKPQRFFYDLLTEIYPNDNIRYNYKPKFLQKINHSGYTGHREIDIFLGDVNLGIEVQGNQHYEFTPQFHRDTDQFLSMQDRDQWKLNKCKENNVRLIWIKDRPVIQSIMKLSHEDAVKKVAAYIRDFTNSNQLFIHWDNL
ncbi:MAG: hypothetical protein KDJ34_04505 [Candidatus Competibacteraceae bacterium]|nr:hypothetical protein [Candidatus Competibacteraceae bacterium]